MLLISIVVGALIQSVGTAVEAMGNLVGLKGSAIVGAAAAAAMFQNVRKLSIYQFLNSEKT